MLTNLYSLVRGLFLHTVKVELKIFNFLGPRLTAHPDMLSLTLDLTTQLEVILLLRDEGVVALAEVEPLVSAHLQHRGLEVVEV